MHEFTCGTGSSSIHVPQSAQLFQRIIFKKKENEETLSNLECECTCMFGHQEIRQISRIGHCWINHKK